MAEQSDIIKLIKPLLEQEFYVCQKHLEDALARLQGDLGLQGLLRSGANVELTQKEYEKDIEARQRAMLRIVRDTLVAVEARLSTQAAQELKDFARTRLGSHIRELEKKLQNHATGLGLRGCDNLELGADRTLAALDAELEVVIRTSIPQKNTWSEGLYFVDPERLAELRNLSNVSFDLTKLIQLCDELNICYANGCYYAVAMLTRALLDHVPPIFNGARTFSEVASNYAGGKSFKEIAGQLQNSARKIADAHLHLPIRPKEVLPTATQVNVSPAMDAVLAEIVRLLK